MPLVGAAGIRGEEGALIPARAAEFTFLGERPHVVRKVWGFQRGGIRH